MLHKEGAVSAIDSRRVDRGGLAASFFAGLAVLCAGSAGAEERRHGLSAFGDLKYPADFQHFDYVNTDAPKGGRLATMPVSSINTFNDSDDHDCGKAYDMYLVDAEQRSSPSKSAVAMLAIALHAHSRNVRCRSSHGYCRNSLLTPADAQNYLAYGAIHL
ncbi:hypothetical protein [Bradyrhizobium sp. 5.13L]